MSAKALGTVALLSLTVAACGGSSAHPAATTTATTSARAAAHSAARPQRATAPVRLVPAQTLASLPEARSGVAAAAFGDGIVVAGGLSPAGVSTDTVIRLAPHATPRSASPLPGPVHDAAATEVGGRLLLFGGGESEGSDRIVSVAPGTPRVIGTLPQALSDLTAVAIGGRAYVVGGWNGTATNRDIYAVSATGRVTTVGRLELGVRYPAAAALDGRVIVAGGETTAGTPTTRAWSFDPASGRVTRLPDLPAPTDHTEGAVLGGRFYLLGGLRAGSFTRAILSWAPGESRWRAAGHLNRAVADAGAVAFDGGIAFIGGRDSAGKLATVTLLRAG